MTESEYIKTANRARLLAAQTIVGQVIPDEGVTKEELREIINRLEVITERIAEEIEVKKL